MDYNYLVYLSNQQNIPEITTTKREVLKVIHGLHTGKAPDAHGIQVEHFRYAGPVVIEFLTTAINLIFSLRMLPRFLKEGILSSISKKKYPIFDPNNHRGITVIVVLSKVVETIMMERSAPILYQNPLQRGFSSGVSPIQASLLVQLAISDAQTQRKPLYIAYLDAKAAFDVVWVKSLLRRLHTAGLHGPLWKMFQTLHEDATSKVKWAQETSGTFNILQGVRQGASPRPQSTNSSLTPSLMSFPPRAWGPALVPSQ